MAAGETASNGHSKLENAMATLIQNQADFMTQMSQAEKERLAIERRHLEYEANARVARIETQMMDVVRVLTDHNKQLEKLTEAVRDRIGFKA